MRSSAIVWEGFQTENLGLSRIDFKADKAAIQLPEYYRMKQEGINVVTSPRPGQPATESLRGNSTQIKGVPMKSHSYAGHLDLSHKKLGDDYTYAAIKALGTTVHRTDLDYLAMKELEKAFQRVKTKKVMMTVMWTLPIRTKLTRMMQGETKRKEISGPIVE